MPITRITTVALATVGCAAMATAFVEPDPVYTHVESNDASVMSSRTLFGNDQFIDAEVIAVPEEFRDCFYVTGKLQKDCVWDRQPKCFIGAFSKDFKATKNDGTVVEDVEELLVGTLSGALETSVLEDGTVRLAIAIDRDGFDGTVNGLASNGPHGKYGKVCVAIQFMDGDAAIGEPIEYDFEFNGQSEDQNEILGDALRLGLAAPQGATSVLVTCDDSCGMKEVCYDVDFYRVEGLRPDEIYCVTVMGGLDEACQPTDTVLGWFSKTGDMEGGPLVGDLGGGIDDEGNANVVGYSELCVFSDEIGAVRFAITGFPDFDFNGLSDDLQRDYFDFLEDNAFEGVDSDGPYIEEGQKLGQFWVPGASLKDVSADNVIRLTRRDWELFPEFQCPPGHGICGGYCLKIRWNDHFENGGGDRGDIAVNASLVDIDANGYVDAADLSVLLSFWGPLQ